MRGPRVKPVVIAAGGTGGHFFPAEALAAALIARGERVVLMTDARAAAGKSPVFESCETHVIPGAGIAGRSFARALGGALAIGRGVLAARGIMAPLSPAVVVGFGGYPAVAPVLAARIVPRRPVVILHDQNAFLGKANQFLAKFSDQVALSFASTAGLPAGRKTVLTGNPVRAAITARARAPYTPSSDKINILVLGGSLGATIFATLIPAALAHLPPALLERVSLNMQCPASSIETARAALLACGVTATLAPFFADVATLLENAHLVLARSGGSTVAELAVIGRPAILVPLRINEDQRANAQALAAAGGAIMVDQSEGAQVLAAALQSLLENPQTLAMMAEKSGQMGIVDAAERLADLVQSEMARETAS